MLTIFWRKKKQNLVKIWAQNQCFRPFQSVAGKMKRGQPALCDSLSVDYSTSSVTIMLFVSRSSTLPWSLTSLIVSVLVVGSEAGVYQRRIDAFDAIVVEAFVFEQENPDGAPVIIPQPESQHLEHQQGINCHYIGHFYDARYVNRGQPLPSQTYTSFMIRQVMLHWICMIFLFCGLIFGKLTKTKRNIHIRGWSSATESDFLRRYWLIYSIACHCYLYFFHVITCQIDWLGNKGLRGVGINMYVVILIISSFTKTEANHHLKKQNKKKTKKNPRKTGYPMNPNTADQIKAARPPGSIRAAFGEHRWASHP